MSRGGLAVLVSALTVTALTACSAGAGGSTETGREPPSRDTVALAAPVAVRSPATTAVVAAATVPLTYGDDGPTVPAVAPGWAERPQEQDGVFVGRGPVDADGTVAIVAVDPSGTILWRARGPEGTRVELGRLTTGRSVVVLAAPGSAGASSAGGYDLATGATVWERDIPGPLSGPGLLVSAPSGARLLDAETGTTVPLPAGGRVVAERDGVVLTAAGDHLEGLRDGVRVWTTPLTALGLPADAEPAIVPGATPPRGTLVLGDGGPGAPSSGALLDVATGAVVATGVRDARADPVLGSWIVLGERALSALEGSAVVWSRPVPDGATLAAVDRVLAYVRTGDAVLAVNTATGADAQAYGTTARGPLAVPAVAGSDGGVALSTGRWILLTTTRP